MSKKSIFVAFNAKDLKVFVNMVQTNDIILATSDIIADSLVRHPTVVDVIDYKFVSSHYLKETREVFSRISTLVSRDIKGFSNNFYECSITILAQYIECLSHILMSDEEQKEVVFAKKIYFLSGPNYYLAEHESQGRILYSRAFAFQQTLENFIKKERKVKIRYLGRGFSYQLVLNLIRDSAVFFSRLIKRCKPNVAKNADKQSDLSVAETVIIIRNLSQFYVLRPLIENHPHAISIVCGDTYTGGQILPHVLPWSKLHSQVRIHSFNPLKLSTIVWEHIKVLAKYFRLKRQIFSVGNIDIDITQAIREILIMTAEVELYRKQLDEVLLNAKDGYLLTCEQKSPQAYVDATVAKSYNYRCIQIMSCDQDSNDLPFPVFGDRFVVDTLKRKELFATHWSTNVEKLAYIGSLKSMVSPVKQQVGIKFEYCYFAHAVEAEHNLKIVESLERLMQQDSNFSYCIKLHPRDSGSWINNKLVQYGVVYKHSQISNDELFKQFKIGISNPSGVVMDLLCRLKPFIFIDVLPSYKNIEFVYCDIQYKGYINDLGSLNELIKSKFVNNEEVSQLYTRVFGESDMSPSIELLQQSV